jgi:hypothetical protein
MRPSEMSASRNAGAPRDWDGSHLSLWTNSYFPPWTTREKCSGEGSGGSLEWKCGNS